MKRLIFNIGHWGQKNKTAHRNDVLSCREEATRTPDPHVPNVVRYQLRYFSLFVASHHTYPLLR